jgi:hypothetical protein
VMTEIVSGHELTRTYDCRTPSCTGEATAATGRNAYRRLCRMARGTLTPEGKPLKSANHPPARPAIEENEAGSESDMQTAADDMDEGPGLFEERALVLFDTACEVDEAVEQFREARPRLERAVAAWRAALARVAENSPGVSVSLNGASEASETSVET